MSESESPKDLYMLSLWLDQRRLVEIGKMLHLPLRHVELEYLTHCALGEAFQDNAPSVFWAERGSSAERHMRVLAYSDLPLESLQAISQALATPVIYETIDWERSACKPMPSTFPVGMKLGFALKLCPVVRLASDCTALDPKGGGERLYWAGSELDAYQAARIRGEDERTRQEVYRDWLVGRLGEAQGVRLETFDLEQFSLEKMLRRTRSDPRKSKTITRPVVSVRGEFEVLDSESFARTLSRGIGRHRGFGFGMFRVRRIGSR